MKLFKKTIMILLMWHTASTLYTASACIIVHGTWAKSASWYQQEGDFFKAVEASNKKLQVVDHIIPFSWSGALSHKDRTRAAHALAQIIEEFEWVYLIAHSYGATVGMIASHILSESNTDRNNKHKIKKFYLLGAPIFELSITPNLFTIEKVYNLFSFADTIQPIHGTHRWRLTKKPGIMNIAIMIDDHYLDHSEMHHPLIGSMLLSLESYCSTLHHKSGIAIPSAEDGLLKLYTYKPAEYSEQPDQKLIEDIYTLMYYRNKPIS